MEWFPFFGNMSRPERSKRAKFGMTHVVRASIIEKSDFSPSEGLRFTDKLSDSVVNFHYELTSHLRPRHKSSLFWRGRGCKVRF